MYNPDTSESLDRRALLKFLGVGTGVLVVQTLPGCSWLSERVEKQVFTEAVPQSGAEASENVAHEALRAWKSVLRAYNQLEQVDRLEFARRIEQAKRKTLRMLDKFDREGLSAQIDDTLRIAPERFEASTEIRARLHEEFKDVLLQRQLEQLSNFLMRPITNEGPKRVLNEGGISSYLRRQLANAQTNPSATSQVYTQAALLDFGDFYCWLALCAAAVAVAAALCAMFPNTEICENAWWVAVGVCIGALACLLP